MVDIRRGDNIISVRPIIDRSDNDMYTIAVKSGILRTKYSRNEFDVCLQETAVCQTSINKIALLYDRH